ncbi:prevent-host-death family protein [Saccharopolyspora spinosa]|uniref:Prevent-host-death family protein n=2 Tax=Saccharopolyspora spinosa TaxID=60894 RepID=A0A2N3Y9G7_SACSN|nr:prevent-host-death family protein [Saccharopolyspora spinosa]
MLRSRESRERRWKVASTSCDAGNVEDMAAEFTVDEARERLVELLDRAESGEEIVITRFGAPSVWLQPARTRSTTGGFAAGVIAASWVVPTGGDAFDVGTDYWPDSSAG